MKKLLTAFLLMIMSSMNLWIYTFVDFTCYVLIYFNSALFLKIEAGFLFLVLLAGVYDLYKRRFSLSITVFLIVANLTSLAMLCFFMWLMLFKSTWEDVVMDNVMFIIHSSWTYDELKEFIDLTFDTWPKLASYNSFDRAIVLMEVWQNTQTVEEVMDLCLDLASSKPWRKNGVYGLEPITMYVLCPEYFGKRYESMNMLKSVWGP